MLDPRRIRGEFPEILELEKKGYIYLDNNATTPKPRSVIEAVKNFYEKNYATVRRGVYSLSLEATRVVEESLESIARLIGSDPEEVVPTFNSTDAMNMIALTLAPSLGEGDYIALTRAEHHSTIMPWRYVCRLRGCRIVWIDVNRYGEVSIESLKEKFEKIGRIKAVIAVHVSNVNGVINPIREICGIASKEGALFIGDLAQSVSHMKVDVKELGIDAGVFSGHKMFGPSGTGVLYLRKDLGERLEPGKAGSGMIVKIDPESLEVVFENMPWRFVPGTPNIEGIVGLGEAARFLREIGMDNVLSYLRRLQAYGEKILREYLEDRIEIYSPPPEKGTGVLSFNIKGIDPHQLAFQLDLEGIAVRSGHHCAYPLHKSLGIEKSVRASPHIYNLEEEIERLGETLARITPNAKKPATGNEDSCRFSSC
ncbi:cysteine desulfurase [Desulfurococcaceae archaeon AG1]|nr:cysteine desulfurase [Desulfurococcaceae archaeon AG1]